MNSLSSLAKRNINDLSVRNNSLKYYRSLILGVKSKGFTIIELMIVLVLLAVILLKALPFTSDWVNNSKVTDAESALIEAIGLAKAQALRNGPGIIDGKAVSSVCLASDFLSVMEAADDSSPAECANSVRRWRSSMHSNVSVQQGGVDFTCLCFDAKAQFTVLGGCAACSISTSFDLAAGGISENVEIY